MSHYHKFAARFANQEQLVKALIDCGFAKQDIEIHSTPQHLIDYCGKQRPETAQVIVRRHNIDTASNDLGFAFEEDAFTPIICDYDSRRRLNEEWRNKLTQRYAYHATVDTLQAQGYELSEETEENGTIKLVLNSYSVG